MTLYFFTAEVSYWTGLDEQTDNLFVSCPSLPCSLSLLSSQRVYSTSPVSSWCALCPLMPPHVAASGGKAPAAPGSGCASPPWSQSAAAPPKWTRKRGQVCRGVQIQFTFNYMHNCTGTADMHHREETCSMFPHWYILSWSQISLTRIEI